MNWSVGQALLEQYRIQQAGTRGGMGLAHQVRHLDCGLDHALKRPRADFAKSPGTLAAFEDEIETWAELGLHPNATLRTISKSVARHVCPELLRAWMFMF